MKNDSIGKQFDFVRFAMLLSDSIKFSEVRLDLTVKDRHSNNKLIPKRILSTPVHST